MGRTLLVLLLCCSLCGCTRVTVHKNPTSCDKGIRYYRPKPYLFIMPDTPSESGKPTLSATTSIKQNSPLQFQQVTDASFSASVMETGYTSPEQLPAQAPSSPLPNTRPEPAPGADTRGVQPDIQPVKISIQMMYMPDFSEEYSIQLKPGLGVGELNIKLDNGWNLTSVGMKTDQQTDEIIKSTADLVSSIGSLAGSFGEGDDRQLGGNVLATNIPFGFYEAVIATDPCGRKQLFGWRYVGFMPFQACPTTGIGMSMVCCEDPNAIYGLVMDSKGVLRFNKIGEVKDAKVMSDPPETASTNTSTDSPSMLHQEHDSLTRKVRG